MIIAIDGPAGTGKSTIAQMLAKKLGTVYFDSGSLYRLFALHLILNHVDYKDPAQVHHALTQFDFDIKNEDDCYRYFLNNQDVSSEIRQQKISELASLISQDRVVREKLLPFQRSLALRHSIVMEGRDIATVVFPNAEFKFFLTAKPEIRAQRRLDQLKTKFPDRHFEFNDILTEQNLRDEQDSRRAIAPLKQDLCAILIDTSDLAIEDVLKIMMDIIKQ